MRIRLTVTVIAAATFFDMAASKAYDGPWCAQYALGLGGVVEDCRMRSFAMCHQEIIGGNRGFCFPNPRWQGKSRAGGPRPRAYRKHSYN
jgi:hypothetical protein